MNLSNEQPIDVYAALKKLWAKRLSFLLVWVITIVVVGAGTYLLPEKWKSSIKIVPEFNLQEAQDFSSIFLEMKLDMQISPMGDAIAPILYADVIKDSHFLNELASQSVEDQNHQVCTIASLYKKAKSEELLHEQMREDIVCKISRKNESITISYTAHDPMIAKQVVELIGQQLSAYLTDYRLQKATRNMDYYSQLAMDGEVAAAMCEIAQVRLKEHQPPFIIIQHAEKPIHKESPKRVQIVVIAWLLVTLFMMGWYWRKDIAQWL